MRGSIGGCINETILSNIVHCSLLDEIYLLVLSIL